MAGNVKKIIKSLTDQIIKSPVYNNASNVFKNTFNVTQEKISYLQHVGSDKYNNIAKDLITTASQPPTPLPNRLVNYWHWYQQLTGLDKVELAKQNVVFLQNKLFVCQDLRRDLTRQANSINDNLKTIYSELIHTKRNDPKYVQLTISENKSLQDQTKITEELSLLEKEERDYFTQLATAIKEYHDSQTINAQNYKYLSIFASALLAIVSLTGSMIYNNKRITDVRNLISKAQDSMETNINEKYSAIISKIESHEKNITLALEKPMIFETSNSKDEIKITETLLGDKVDNKIAQLDLNGITQITNLFVIASFTLFMIFRFYGS